VGGDGERSGVERGRWEEMGRGCDITAWSLCFQPEKKYHSHLDKLMSPPQIAVEVDIALPEEVARKETIVSHERRQRSLLHACKPLQILIHDLNGCYPETF